MTGCDSRQFRGLDLQKTEEHKGSQRDLEKREVLIWGRVCAGCLHCVTVILYLLHPNTQAQPFNTCPSITRWYQRGSPYTRNNTQLSTFHLLSVYYTPIRCPQSANGDVELNDWVSVPSGATQLGPGSTVKGQYLSGRPAGLK